MTLLSFVPMDRWTVRHGSISIQWREPPRVSSRQLTLLMAQGTLDEVRDALGRFRVESVPSSEKALANLLQHSEDEVVLSRTARLLAHGRTRVSLEVLQRTAPEVIGRQQDLAVVEIVAALYSRGRRGLLKDLIRYAESLDPERLVRVVGLSLLRGIPASVWREHLLSHLERAATGRFVAARVRLQRHDTAGEAILRDALSSSAADRHLAAAAIANVRSRRAVNLLKAALEREMDVSIQLMMCACLGRHCSTTSRVEVLSRASSQESPVIRYQAALQLGFLRPGAKRRIVEVWLKKEPDRVIRGLLRSAVAGR